MKPLWLEIFSTISSIVYNLLVINMLYPHPERKFNGIKLYDIWKKTPNFAPLLIIWHYDDVKPVDLLNIKYLSSCE